MNEELERVLNEHVRPLLRTHGGDMEVLSLEDGILRFKLTGRCSGCPAADLTTEELIRGEILERLPQVKRVVLIQEISQELIDQAKAIMRQRHGQ